MDLKSIAKKFKVGMEFKIYPNMSPPSSEIDSSQRFRPRLSRNPSLLMIDAISYKKWTIY
jgi:hypothetical protein